MKRAYILTLVISILISCNPCRHLDCQQSNYTFKFKLLNSSDDSDLFFGSQSVYNPNQIQFYSINGNDTTIYSYEKMAYGSDSIISVDFFPETNLVFMELDNGDLDTFQIEYKTESTECCGIITTIPKLIYNNQETSVDNQPKIIRK